MRYKFLKNISSVTFQLFRVGTDKEADISRCEKEL